MTEQQSKPIQAPAAPVPDSPKSAPESSDPAFVPAGPASANLPAPANTRPDSAEEPPSQGSGTDRSGVGPKARGEPLAASNTASVADGKFEKPANAPAKPERTSPQPLGPETRVEPGSKATVIVQDPLTPVIPETEALPRRAYQLHWELDVSLFAMGAALSLGREIRATNSSAPAYCTTVAEGCDRSDLNGLDRPFAGRYDENWSDVTDYAVWSLLAAPWPMLWANNTLANTVNDLVVIYESALTAVALSSLATLSASRARPFVYGTKAPQSVRNSPNGALSFVSGHTTLAFSLSTSTIWTVYRRHGSASPFTWVSFGVCTAVATLVGAGRVMAGKHFPTDVITGAAVGSAVGTLIPSLHGRPVAVIPNADTDSGGLSLVGWF